jgi:hypothetical protein
MNSRIGHLLHSRVLKRELTVKLVLIFSLILMHEDDNGCYFPQLKQY